MLKSFTYPTLPQLISRALSGLQKENNGRYAHCFASIRCCSGCFSLHCVLIVRKASKAPHDTEELGCAQRVSKEKLQTINKTWEEYYNLSLQGKALPHLGSNGTSSLLTIPFSSVKRSSQETFQEEPHIITVE